MSNSILNYILATTVFLSLISFASVAKESEKRETHFTSYSGKKISSRLLNLKITEAMNKLKVPGLSIAIIDNNNIVYHEVFGVESFAQPNPITKKTIFEGASLSKPMFSFFALKMVEEGKLDLDKSMFEYLPHPGIATQSIDYAKQITPRMILSHTSGFPNWSNNSKITLSEPPGEKFSYSGEAYQYLAAVIGMTNQVGWQEDLNEIFLKSVAEPLGLIHTTFTWNDYIEEHKAYGHQRGEVTDNNKGGWNGKTFGAGYSLHTEAYEYALFLNSILKRDALDEKLYNQMFIIYTDLPTDHEGRKLGQIGWTLGWAAKQSNYGRSYLHTGNNHDFQAFAEIFPDKGAGLVFFTNSDLAEPFYLELVNILE